MQRLGSLRAGAIPVPTRLTRSTKSPSLIPRTPCRAPSTRAPGWRLACFEYGARQCLIDDCGRPAALRNYECLFRPRLPRQFICLQKEAEWPVTPSSYLTRTVGVDARHLWPRPPRFKNRAAIFRLRSLERDCSARPLPGLCPRFWPDKGHGPRYSLCRPIGRHCRDMQPHQRMR